MVALNFKSQFAPAVEKGIKRRSIRAWRKDKRYPLPGQSLQLYTGMRTRYCRKLADATCTRICPVQITDREIMVDGSLVPPKCRNIFAHLDGFNSFTEMVAFFKETHGLPFSGALIEWGPLTDAPVAQSTGAGEEKR